MQSQFAVASRPVPTVCYRRLIGRLGTPDFWGRYLTDTVCPPDKSRRGRTAAHFHMGILRSTSATTARWSATARTGLRWRDVRASDLVFRGSAIAVVSSRQAMHANAASDGRSKLRSRMV